jgi:hypothetical protein
VGSADNNVYIYDPNLNLTNTLTDSGGTVYAVAFSQSDGRLAVGSEDNDAYIYNSNLSLKNTLTDANGAVYGVAFDPVGRLATGTIEDNAFFYDSNLSLTNTLTDANGRVNHLEFSPNGTLAVPSWDNNTYVYDSTVATTIFISFSDLDLSANGFSSPPADAVVAHDFTPDTDDTHTIEYTVSDQSGNSVIISESQVGEIVDVSSLQDTTLSIQVDVTDDDFNASLDDFAIHFNE